MAVVTQVNDYSQIDTTTLDGVNLIVTLPAAFSDTCTKECVPNILHNLKRIKEAGAKRVILVCSDQPFAVAEWVRYSQWSDIDAIFASDFGCFQMREIVGRAGEEQGKKNLPRALGDLLRRAYVVVKDGKILGKYVEPDALDFTLKVEELIAGIRAVSAAAPTQETEVSLQNR